MGDPEYIDLEDFFYTWFRTEPVIENQLFSDSSELYVDYNLLYNESPKAAMALYESPDETLALMEDVAKTPNGELMRQKTIRIQNSPFHIPLRELSSEYVGKLIQVEGVVNKTALPKNVVTSAMFQCQTCGNLIGPIHQNWEVGITKPDECENCKNRKSNRFEIIPLKSERMDIQKIYIQENPGELPPGQLPETLESLLSGGLIRSTYPGGRVRVNGVLRLTPTRNPLIFDNCFHINNIEGKGGDIEELDITEDDMERFKELSKSPLLDSIMIRNFAPSIYGWDNVKQGMVYSMFGGVSKIKGGQRVRGDIHILMAGDPGTGKTQMLLFARDLSPRGVYAAGRGASAVGLTAALVKEGDNFVLVAGAMPMADNGTACLDELEKMNDEDRANIHPAMSQQIIPVNKGGIRATLNSRCNTLAACNPTEGRYDTYKTIPENVKNLPVALLSRFDLIFIMPDNSGVEKDTAMANRILGLDDSEPLPMLSVVDMRKYVSYAKANHTPTIPRELMEMIRSYYVMKRNEGMNQVGVSITARQLESVERLVEARARMHLRDEAIEDDIAVVFELFDTFLNGACRDPYTGNTDMSLILTEIPESLKKQSERIPLLIEYMSSDLELSHVADDGTEYVRKEDLITTMVDKWGVTRNRAKDAINRAMLADYIWNPKPDYICVSE